jgi:gamma-glutamylcyclotransferase (GGCT)/AIG2-like uncharacterized protein YtfP
MLVFVYGSLKSKERNNLRYLGNQRFVSFARTLPRYKLYDCGQFPGLVEATEGVSVVGELWDVDNHCLMELDYLEAVDQGLYKRELIQLQDPVVQAQVYLFCHNVQGLPDCGEIWEGEQWGGTLESYRSERTENEKRPRTSYVTNNSDSISRPILW